MVASLRRAIWTSGAEARPVTAAEVATRRWAGWRYPVGGDSERGVHVTDTRTGSASVSTTGDRGPLSARTGSSRREVRVTAVRSGADDWIVPSRPAAQRIGIGSVAVAVAVSGSGERSGSVRYFCFASHAVSGALWRASMAAQVSMRSIAWRRLRAAAGSGCASKNAFTSFARAVEQKPPRPPTM